MKESGTQDSLRLLLSSDPCVLIESAAGPRLFANPEFVVRANDLRELPDAYQKLDEAIASGLIAAGFIAYDSGGNAALKNPLLWFGCFKGWESISENSLRSINAAYRFESEELFESGKKEADQFRSAVTNIRESIQNGTVYQVNYTQRENFRFEGSDLALYARLRILQPARHRAFIRLENHSILSLSPELFFSINAGAEDGCRIISSQPMKGTRGKSGENLLTSERMLAENHMILDLMRNDFGRFAEIGSVRVDSAGEIVRLPGVEQLISVLSARLKNNTKIFSEIIPSIFPPGSVTGTPKIAACRKIEELEHPRGVYTGTIGFASSRESSFNVAIRTLQIDKSRNRAVFGSGCGIVWDSKPDDEWQEYRLKKDFLRPAQTNFHLIETMRTNAGKCYLLLRHLRRMRKSAAALQIPYNARKLLRYLRDSIQTDQDQRIRIALYSDGRFQVSVAEAPAFRFGIKSLSAKYRVRISDHHIRSDNAYQYHKSSERLAYDSHIASARATGLDDFIFLNERENVVESCIANLLIYSNGVWHTPAPDSGALDGIMLGHLLARYGDRIEMRNISPEEVRSASRSGRLFLSNSVRGLFRATLVD